MKKIGLFLGTEPYTGGTFQYNQVILDAAASLPENEFSVVVGYTSELWIKYLQNYYLKTIPVPLGFCGRAAGYLWKSLGLPVTIWRQVIPYFHPVAKTLLAERCDIWIFPSQDQWGYEIPVPSLVAVHDLMHRYERRFPEVSGKGEYRRRERHYKNICRWAKGVLVDSEVGKRQVMDSYGLDAERIHVLPFIAPAYMHGQKENNDFDSRYQLPKKFIFYPAQFWEHKNHKRLISAVEKLKHDIPDLKLVLVGSKKNGYESVVKLVQELNLMEDVIFLGYVPDEDIRQLYQRARALVMPTFFGPTNIPPLEAFVAGCPVAISGIYGMPEQVGDAALLFDPESVDEIAGSIRRLWIDDKLCNDLTEKGRHKAAIWGQEQFNARFRKIIEQIVFGYPKISGYKSGSARRKHREVGEEVCGFV